MERFDDQPLGPRPHLAVLFQDKLGGFVAATPLLRGLKEKYPDATLDYFGGERTAELEEACPYVDARYSLFGRADSVRALPTFLAERQRLAGAYDLAINLDFHALNAVAMAMLAARYVVGKCYTEDGRSELAHGLKPVDQLASASTYWAGDDFLTRFGDVLQSNYIGEIFCRLARVETDYQRTEVPTAPPPIEVPDVLIVTGVTRSAKLWPTGHWKDLVDLCSAAGLSVGLVGAAPRIQQAVYGSGESDAYLLRETALVDLRGSMTLPEVGGAFQRARGCVTTDNGVMHLANAVGTPTIAVFGGSPWNLWAPSVPTLRLALPNEPCRLCQDNRYLNDACLRERHVCLESISAQEVFAALGRALRPKPAMGPDSGELLEHMIFEL